MITLVNGRRGQGKTTLAYKIALRKATRVIFDPRRSFHTSDVVIHDASELFALMDDEPEIIVQPYSDVKNSFEAITGEFRQWTIENPLEPACLLVDECRFVDLPNFSYEPFDQITRFSEGELVDVIMTCHRPSDVDVATRAIADFLCFFRTTQEHDLKVIQQRCGEQVAELVKALPDKHFVIWDDGQALFEVRDDPTKWYVDIKRFNGVNKVVYEAS